MIKFAFGLLLGLYTSNGYYKQNKYMAYTIAEYQRTVGIYKQFLKRFSFKTDNLNYLLERFIFSDKYANKLMPLFALRYCTKFKKHSFFFYFICI